MSTATVNSSQLKKSLPWLALLCSIVVFGLHFYQGGGQSKLINDSLAYLDMAEGRGAGPPFDTRVLVPKMASLIAATFGVTPMAAFQILTLVSLIAALVLLKAIIAGQGGSFEWQAAVLLALGAALAATFGYAPVMIDLFLLVITCLTVLAIHRDWLWACLILVLLAALTKEYGILLGFACSLVAWRRHQRQLSVLLTLLPVAAVLSLMTAGSTSKGRMFSTWELFISAMFDYHRYLFTFRGPLQYFEILYMWLWSVLWPVLFIAVGIIVSRLRNRVPKSDHEIGFFLMLLALPLLLLGDWGRALLIVVPFACAVATAHPLTKTSQFSALLAIGGASTALARPFHSEFPPPQWLTLGLIVISVATSILIALRIFKINTLANPSRRDAGLEDPLNATLDR